MDNTHTILKETHSQEFSDHLNSMADDIKETAVGEVMTETEVRWETVAGEEDVSVNVERTLAFLNMWTVVKPNGSISTKVFRKETQTDHYLNFSSNLPTGAQEGDCQDADE